MDIRNRIGAWVKAIKEFKMPVYIRYNEKTLDYKHIKGWKIWARRAGVCFGFLTLGYIISPGEILRTKHVEYEDVPLIIKQDLEFSEERAWQMLHDLHVRFPHIVIAQARIESARYSSKIYRANNNMFGMKISKGRCTTHHGEQYGHALYYNWQESVLDYAFFQTSYLRDLKSEAQYYEYLAAHYAEAGESYANSVRTEAAKVKKQYENWEGDDDTELYGDSITGDSVVVGRIVKELTAHGNNSEKAETK